MRSLFLVVLAGLVGALAAAAPPCRALYARSDCTWVPVGTPLAGVSAQRLIGGSTVVTPPAVFYNPGGGQAGSAGELRQLVERRGAARAACNHGGWDAWR